MDEKGGCRAQRWSSGVLAGEGQSHCLKQGSWLLVQGSFCGTVLPHQSERRPRLQMSLQGVVFLGKKQLYNEVPVCVQASPSWDQGMFSGEKRLHFFIRHLLQYWREPELSQSYCISRVASQLGKKAGPMGCSFRCWGPPVTYWTCLSWNKSTFLLPRGLLEVQPPHDTGVSGVSRFLWEREYPQEKEAAVDGQYNYTRVSLPSSPGVHGQVWLNMLCSELSVLSRRLCCALQPSADLCPAC